MQQPGDPYTFPAAGRSEPEAPPEPAGGEWFPLAEAANRVGASQAALRQSVRDGALRSRGSGRHVEVWIEAEGE